MQLGRKTPAHHPPVERHNEPVIILVTVCSKNRRSIFASQDVFDLLQHVWREADRWSVGGFVLMPDHIHLFCSPGPTSDGQALLTWLRYWKAAAARVWPSPVELPIWQRDGWDRQLRSAEHYHERWEYVRNNPVRKGLVANSNAWPWQGTINELRW